MNIIFSMLGKGLIKKEKKIKVKDLSIEDEGRRAKKKIIVELFLRDVLGTRLLEKKF